MIENKGTLVYDPVAYATGRRKLAKLRLFSIEILGALKQAYSELPIENRLEIDDIVQKSCKQNWMLNTIPSNEILPLMSLFKNCCTVLGSKELLDLQARIKSALIISKIRPNWAILNVPITLIEPTRGLIAKAQGQKPAIPSWGPHITVVRGEPLPWPYSWKKYEGQEIPYYFYPEIKEGRNRYFYLDVWSPALEEIRVNLGLKKHPTPNFHITIGCIR